MRVNCLDEVNDPTVELVREPPTGTEVAMEAWDWATELVMADLAIEVVEVVREPIGTEAVTRNDPLVDGALDDAALLAKFWIFELTPDAVGADPTNDLCEAETTVDPTDGLGWIVLDVEVVLDALNGTETECMADEATELVLEPPKIEGITLLMADGATEAMEVVLDDTIGTEACDLTADEAIEVVLFSDATVKGVLDPIIEGIMLLTTCDALDVVLELGAEDFDL